MTQESGKQPAEPAEYDFYEDYEDPGSIFEDRSNPPGAFGDPDAIEDLQAQSAAVPMQGMQAPDGLVAPSPEFDAMAILGEPTRVTSDELVCLAGPCTHYSEAVIQVGGLRVTERRCKQVLTWAEQTQLDDAVILGCNRHEADSQLHPAVEARVWQGYRRIRLANERAVKALGHTLGVCHEAACKHCLIMSLGVYQDGAYVPQDHRWCLKKGGAARPYKLDLNAPVLGCSAVEAGDPIDALDRSRAYLEEERKKRAAGRRAKGPEEDGDSTRETD